MPCRFGLSVKWSDLSSGAGCLAVSAAVPDQGKERRALCCCTDQATQQLLPLGGATIDACVKHVVEPRARLCGLLSRAMQHLDNAEQRLAGYLFVNEQSQRSSSAHASSTPTPPGGRSTTSAWSHSGREASPDPQRLLQKRSTPRRERWQEVTTRHCGSTTSGIGSSFRDAGSRPRWCRAASSRGLTGR